MPELTRFVREVVLPGSVAVTPRLVRRHCCFRLELRRSPIHRWGVFAAEPIPARRRVIEYTGERIDVREAQRRSVRQHLYVFWLNDRTAIDGAHGGSGAEYINHRCTPNLAARKNGCRIYFTTLCPIATGEELTLDYALDDDAAPLACTCGSPLCRGVMNRIETQSAAGR